MEGHNYSDINKKITDTFNYIKTESLDNIIKYFESNYDMNASDICDTFDDCFIEYKKNDIDILKWLYSQCSASIQINPFIIRHKIRESCINGNLDMCKWLISLNIKTNAISNAFLYMLICKTTQLDIMRWIIKNYPDIITPRIDLALKKYHNIDFTQC